MTDKSLYLGLGQTGQFQSSLLMPCGSQDRTQTVRPVTKHLYCWDTSMAPTLLICKTEGGKNYSYQHFLVCSDSRYHSDLELLVIPLLCPPNCRLSQCTQMSIVNELDTFENTRGLIIVHFIFLSSEIQN